MKLKLLSWLRIKRLCSSPEGGGLFPALIGLLLLINFSTALKAAEFKISLDADTITLGQSVNMTMTFVGNSSGNYPVPPTVPGLNILDAHSDSSSFSLGPGGMTAVRSHMFVVTPAQLGTFVIPSLTANVDGQVVHSQPVKLTVTKTPPAPSGINTANPDPYFLRLNVPKQTVYVGEVIRGELLIYLREGIQPLDHGIQVTPPQAEGFTLGGMAGSQSRQTRIGNLGYNVIPVGITFTAVKAGKLTLGGIECNLALAIGTMDFFGRYRRQSASLTNTDTVTIESLPLPRENVPPGFNGAVGNYAMNLSVSPTNIAVGDPITVKVEISGNGSLQSLTLPEQRGWNQFKAYPPTSNFQHEDELNASGTNTFSLTIVPENMDVHEVPPFAFSFFDPDQKTYRTLTHPAVPLTVRPSAASLPPPSLGGASSSDNPQPVQDVSPIKPRLGVAAQISPLLVRQPWFLVLQAIPALAWLSLLINRKQHERLANNPRLRRQRQVEQTIRAGLHELHQSANANDGPAFFATMIHLLQERIGERLDLPASGITEAILEERLRPMQVPEEELTLLRELFFACNQARYSPHTTHAELVSLIPKLESALNNLKKISV